MAVLGSCLHRIRASLHIIAQGFGFTRDFLKERNNRAYFRLKKIPCGFKEQARARHPGEICGLILNKKSTAAAVLFMQRSIARYSQ